MKSTIHINKDINGLHQLISNREGIFVIIDNNLQHLAENFKEYPSISLNFSEQKKTLDTIAQIAGWLLESGADRNALVIGIGGGITTDMSGFAASIYKRGVKFAFVPTTLLAQVDASIGGKNGVNFDSYKNILGTINQPEWIFICPQLLATLPEDEFKAGIAEVLKTFVLFDRQMYCKAVDYFAAVALSRSGDNAGKAAYGENAVAYDMELLQEIIGKCAQYKSGVVERDEFEKGERRLLNLGHTFAHAIEKLAGGNISHGYAVSIGMVIAARFAQELASADKEFAQMLSDDLRRCGLPASLQDLPQTAHLAVADLAVAVTKDKKVSGSNIHFILPAGLENVEDVLVPLETVKRIANDLC